MQHLILILALLLPVLLSYIFFKKFNAIVILIAFALGVAFNFGISEFMKFRNIADTEYVGYTAVRVEYYESWDEWINETCTDDNGQEYDCSYCEYHSSYWTMVDNGGYSENITEKEYNDIVRFLHGTPVFHELNRNYYTVDGDMYYVNIPLEQLVIPITRTRKYANRILTNQSLYHYNIITDKEKDLLKLFDYPKIDHYSPHPYPNPFPKSVCTYQSATMGCADDTFTLRMNIINALYGDSLRTFVFFYPDGKRELAQKQIDRLKLGNFNELIIMLGLKNNEITWCETHSWEDVPTLRTAVKQWFNTNKHTNKLKDFPNWYMPQLNAGLWKLKDCHDFDYIRINFSLVQLAKIGIAQIVFQIFLFLYIIVLLRPVKKMKEAYKNIEETEEVKMINEKLIDGQKLTQEEQRIIRKQKTANEERTERWKEWMKQNINGYSTILMMCVILLFAFIPNLASFDFISSVKSSAIILVLPCLVSILGIPLCLIRIIVIRRLNKKEKG
jgi:hypothetical protein